MSQPLLASNRETLFDAFDAHAYRGKQQVAARRKLGFEEGVLKSYLLETAYHNGAPDVCSALRTSAFTVTPVAAEDLYRLSHKGEEFGYAEPVSKRFIAVHTARQTRLADEVIKRAVRDSAELDFLWVAGQAFQVFLQNLITPIYPQRQIEIKFRYQNAFNPYLDGGPHAAGAQRLVPAASEGDALEELQEDEGAWTMKVSRPARYLADVLPQYQRIDATWQVIQMLRFPAGEQGGYNLWSWGKMTHWAPTFREGRNLLLFVANLYDKITAAIEETIWLDTQPHHDPEHSYIRFHGTPVVFKFAAPLSDIVFRNFLTMTFEQRKGPFRLWGKPLWRGKHKVHVYGLDLHLWQKLYMEFTPDYFLFVLPRGTCGNTVHRLMANIQHYIDPAVSLSIGNTSYASLVTRALRNEMILHAG